MKMKEFLLSKTQYVCGLILVFLFGLLSLFQGISGVPGFVSLGVFLWFLVYGLRKYFSFGIGLIVIITSTVVTLTFVYYSFGLSYNTLICWFLLAFLCGVFFDSQNRTFSFHYPTFEINKDSFSRKLIFSAILLFALLLYFFVQPIHDGRPSPWIGMSLVIFPFFFLASWIIAYEHFAHQRTDIFSAILYMLVSLVLVALRYVESYGYDSLLHQASLDFIMENGQITPIQPFYIGQYALEILIHAFTRWDFVFIERFLGPLSFITLILIGATRFLHKHSRSVSPWLVVPFSFLLLLPSVFFYTSPFAFAVMWALISLFFLYEFLSEREFSDTARRKVFYLALFSSLVAFLVHPFIGLHSLTGVVCSRLVKRSRTTNGKLLSMTTMFVVSSIIVPISFVAYGWLGNNVVYLTNPFSNMRSFLEIFSGPIWYEPYGKSLWLSVMYAFERVHFFVIMAIALGYTLMS
ncbi:MAG TPA: hypothetical protein VJA22_00675, partial [Patescibacteria group bacterium]|nr:hypothetical protein [Patescibacteria group bacterium]